MSLPAQPLRYLIGTDIPGIGRNDEITVVSYNVTMPLKRGTSVAYCNLFDEYDTGDYGPYLHSSDTAEQYGEGQIDPRGQGWVKNLNEQFDARKRQGFRYIELDNPDAYSIKDVLGAVHLAATYNLAVVAKNPLIMDGNPGPYVAECCGVIVERGAGSPKDMDALRQQIEKPGLPVWFVAFGSGRSWAENTAQHAKPFHNMWVSYSARGEYGSSEDVR